MNKWVDIDWAFELKDSGFPQDDCLFYYMPNLSGETKYCLMDRGYFMEHKDLMVAAAPIATEILERLPPYIEFVRETEREKDRYYLTIKPEQRGSYIKNINWRVAYRRQVSDWVWHSNTIPEAYTSLPNASASMWVWLLMNGHMGDKDE